MTVMLLVLACAALGLRTRTVSTLGRIQPAAHDARNLQGPAVVAGVFAAVLSFLFVGRLTVALAALCAGGTVAWTVADFRRARQAMRTEEALGAFLGVVTADLRAGALLPQAFARGVETLPASTPAGLRRELTTAATIAGRGGALASALDATDGPASTLARLITVSEKHGIPLAGVLEQAQARIDAGQRYRAATRASLQGPQATALVLTGLPLAGIAMGSVMGARPLAFLTGGGLGGVLLLVGVGLVCAGFVWSRHIIEKAAGAS